MKSKFNAHFRPSDPSFAILWKTALFVFDANTILNLYRFSPEARREFLKLLADQKNRIWMPHQAVKEFFRNRLGEIGAQSEHYQQAILKINDVKSMLSLDRGHPYIEDALMKKLSDVFVEVNAELLKNKDNLLTMMSDDPILTELGDLFKDRVGKATERPELEAIFANGGLRIAHFGAATDFSKRGSRLDRA